MSGSVCVRALVQLTCYQIHKGRWTTISICYVLCRYYPLLTWPLFIWTWCFDHNIETCRRVFHAVYFCLIPFVSGYIDLNFSSHLLIYAHPANAPARYDRWLCVGANRH